MYYAIKNKEMKTMQFFDNFEAFRNYVIYWLGGVQYLRHWQQTINRITNASIDNIISAYEKVLSQAVHHKTNEFCFGSFKNCDFIEFSPLQAYTIIGNISSDGYTLQFIERWDCEEGEEY